MTRQEIEALLKILAEMERQEMALLMRERRKGDGGDGCIDKNGDPRVAVNLVHRWLCRDHLV